MGGRGEPARANLDESILRIDYLRPARLDTLVAEARVVRLGNRVGVADIRLYNAHASELTVATGKGVYNISIGRAGRPEIEPGEPGGAVERR